MPDIFPDHDKAFILRNSFNSFIEQTLRSKLSAEKRKNNFKKPYGKRDDRKNNRRVSTRRRNPKRSF